MTLGFQFVHDLLARLLVTFLLGIPLALCGLQLLLPLRPSPVRLFDLLPSVICRPHGLQASSFERLAFEPGLLDFPLPTFAFALFGDFGKVLFAQRGDGAVVMGTLPVVDVGEDGGIERFVAGIFVVGLVGGVGGHHGT